MHITLFALSGLLIALSSSIMAFVMFALGRTRLHILWGGFCISVFIWGIGVYFIGTTLDPAKALYWWKITHVGIAFIPILFLHFVYVFLKRKVRLLIVACYILSTFLSILALYSNLLIANVRFVFGQFYYDSPPGLFYPFFTFYFFALIILSHVLLYSAYRKDARPEFALDRIRIKYFFLGMLISFAGGSLSYLPVYGIDLYPIANFAVILYPIIIGYAILRHQLFDIRTATAQGLTFLLWIFVGVRVAFSTSQEELILNSSLLTAVIVLGIFLVRSISKEIKQRELIEKQEKDLELSNSRQENLLHFISHEVKGYLTRSAAAFSGLGEGDYGALTPEAKALADLALAETRKGIETVMDILDAGNLKTGTVKLAHQPFDLRASVENVIEHYKKAAEEKHLEFSAAIEPGSYTMVGDEAQIRQHVIDNLIDNAIAYTTRGAVSVSLKRQDDAMRLSVTDTGFGLTDEDKAHLFTEGGRGAESTKINAHSTGYGLFIAKSIVAAHGGRISAESEGRGKGSTFTVELPATK